MVLLRSGSKKRPPSFRTLERTKHFTLTYRKVIRLVVLLCIAALPCRGQEFPELQFEHLTVQDGLSSNSVAGITQDHQGFIWIGTSNGLNRYDGYRFKKYYHSSRDSNSLVNNDVQRLYCDRQGRIWISTEDGVSCFMPDQNRFINFSSRHDIRHRLKNNSSVGVYEADDGTIWLTNQMEVIYKVLPDFTLQEIKIGLPPFRFFNLVLQGYDIIFRDNSGTEWAAKANRVYRINTKTKQVEKTFDLANSFEAFILKIAQNRRGEYFFSTYGTGIWHFIAETGSVEKVDLPYKGSIYTDLVNWTYKDADWVIGLEGNTGICLFNSVKKKSRKYINVPGDPTSLAGTNLNQVYVDKGNNLWIASNKGVNKFSAEQNVFDIIPVTDPGTSNYNPASSTAVYAFMETDTSIWLSKRGVSTIEYSPAFHIKNYYRRLFPLSSSGQGFSSCGYAYSIYNRNSEIYMTTDSGLVVYDPVRKKSAVYFPEGLPSIPDLRTIVPLTETEIMIRSFSYGIFIFNTAVKKFERLFSATDFCGDCQLLRFTYLFKTKVGEIFVSTGGLGKGLFRFDSRKSIFQQVKAENEDKLNMLKGDLYGMDEDRDGKLWITGKSGLIIYDPKLNTVIEQQAQNEPEGSLSRICFDDFGNTWANGNAGIWCFIKKKNTWINFNGQDGLPGSLYDGIINKRKNGDIIASVEGGLAIFHPGKITGHYTGSKVVLTEAAVGSKIIAFPLTPGAGKKLTLSPGQNSFSADFTILNYLNPAASRYYYMLTPLTKEYQLNDNGHINFNGLSPGHYTLRVKSGDKAGNIFLEEDILQVYVMPYWYQTRWFKALLVLVLAILVFAFVRWRIKTIRKAALFKQKIAETEMQALRAQMNPHFIFNSLNSIENFMMLNEKRLASDYLNKFSRLIRSILDSSRNELVPLAKDMESLKLYVDLEQLRFDNKFRYQYEADAELLQGDYRVPSLLIQPYVENAIVHGIAHSEKKDLQLAVKAVLENEMIRFTITDNGVGRKQSAVYNQQNKPGHKSVGLQITQDRIEHFNTGSGIQQAVTFTDLYDEQQNAAGTRVEVLIKTI